MLSLLDIYILYSLAQRCSGPVSRIPPATFPARRVCLRNHGSSLTHRTGCLDRSSKWASLQICTNRRRLDVETVEEDLILVPSTVPRASPPALTLVLCLLSSLCLFLVTDEDTVKRYYAKFEEKFFQTCEKELAKINTFYSGTHIYCNPEHSFSQTQSS